MTWVDLALKLCALGRHLRFAHLRHLHASFACSLQGVRGISAFLLSQHLRPSARASSSASLENRPLASSPRKRYYVVIKPVSGGLPGIYRCYASYAKQVQDSRVPFAGRTICICESTESEAFAYVKDAESFWVARTGQPILRRW